MAYLVFAAAGDVFGLLFIGFLLAPRMGEFLGKLSIAEAMGELFGSHVRIITAFFWVRRYYWNNSCPVKNIRGSV